MFYGWKLCFVTFAGNFLLQGSVVYIMNAFLDPLTVANGWTRAEISFGVSIAAFFGALSVLVWTSLASYFSMRALMTFGAFLGGISFIALSFTNQLIFFYIFYTLAWSSGQAFGGAIGNALVNQWFVKKRGKAFGISNIGTSFAGAIIPLVLYIVIMFFDVQTAWFTYGLFVLLMAPVCWLTVRDRPEQMGLHVDNDPNALDLDLSNFVKPTWAEVLKNKDIYIISLSLTLTLTVASSVVSQLKPRMVDLGLDSISAMALTCFTALLLAAAKYIWGRACDFYHPIKILRLLIILIFASLFLTFIPNSLTSLILFSLCFGVTGGGIWVVMPSVVAYYFGKEKFIFYYRVVATFVLIKAIGYAILGFSQQLTNSYDLAYTVFLGILVICLALTYLLKMEPYQD